MINQKNIRIYLACVSVFSVLALSLHMAAIKLIYRSIGILLKANEVTSMEIKKEMALQVEDLKRYSEYFTNSFYLFCCLFLIFAGISLIWRRVGFMLYLSGDFIFAAVQFIGISLFIRIFNTYELTEVYARLRILFRQKLLWILFIIPMAVYLLYGLLKKQGHSS
ncbi:hypothetical protein AALB39_26395 [Lachnospiraceae bacterium 54-53]